MNDDQWQRVAAHDAMLSTAHGHNQQLESVPMQLREAWENMRQLISYYESQWREDFEALGANPEAQFGLLSEDGLWNQMGNFYENLKEIAAVSAAIVAEYEQ